MQELTIHKSNNFTIVFLVYVTFITNIIFLNNTLCKEFFSELYRGFIGAPERIRTPDPLIRNQILYPAELRAHIKSISIT